MEDGNVGGTQVVCANALDPESPHMRLEAGAIQPQRNFGQLPLAASVVEFTNHQQDPRLHFQVTATRFQNSSRSKGAQSALFDCD
jgi:hypothetical protein